MLYPVLTIAKQAKALMTSEVGVFLGVYAMRHAVFSIRQKEHGQ